MKKLILAYCKGDIGYVETFCRNGGNYHYNNDQGFLECRLYGNIDLAEYLFDLGQVDIHYNRDEAFWLSYNKGHMDMAEWIHSMSDVAYWNYFSDEESDIDSNDSDTYSDDSDTYSDSHESYRS